MRYESEEWWVYRSAKGENVAEAEHIATLPSRKEAWEYVVTQCDGEAYDYMVMSSGRVTTTTPGQMTVTFTRGGEVVDTWHVTNPTMLPGDGDRVDIDGQLWIVQQHGRRWHGPNLVEIVLSYRATSEYDKR